MSGTAEQMQANALHIDTVQLNHAFRADDLPRPEELVERGFELSFKNRERSGDITIGRFWPLSRQSHEPRLTVTRSECGYCGIKAEVSIAKLLDGSGLGFQSDEDIECALDAIEDSIRQRTGVNFNAHSAKISRLDVNADFPVGEHRIIPYINAISCRNSRMTRGTVGTTTIQFHNGSRTLIAYGKLEEMIKQHRSRAAKREDVRASKGLLRIESRLRSAPLIRLAGKLDVPANAGHLLTMKVANRIITEALADLHLDEPKFSHRERDRLLVEHFGKSAPTMLGVLALRSKFGEDFWKSLGWSSATYYRARRRLQEVGLWDFSPADELPALVVAPAAYNNSTTLADLRISPAIALAA